MIDQLAAKRAKLEADRAATEAHEAAVMKAYRGEIYDWCGHMLAMDIVAEKMGLSRRAVATIVERNEWV